MTLTFILIAGFTDISGLDGKYSNAVDNEIGNTCQLLADHQSAYVPAVLYKVSDVRNNSNSHPIRDSVGLKLIAINTVSKTNFDPFDR